MQWLIPFKGSYSTIKSFFAGYRTLIQKVNSVSATTYDERSVRYVMTGGTVTYDSTQVSYWHQRPALFYQKSGILTWVEMQYLVQRKEEFFIVMITNVMTFCSLFYP